MVAHLDAQFESRTLHDPLAGEVSQWHAQAWWRQRIQESTRASSQGGRDCLTPREQRSVDRVQVCCQAGAVDEMDRAQLAQFLRVRRAALRPDDVGLGPGARRRTPGLRREEVAALANMSVDYYARLEQQRTSPPSEQMAASIARALRLSLEERDHLFRLAGHDVPRRHAASDQVGPGLMRVLDRLDDTPALVATDLGEVLVQNRLAVALLGDQRGFVGSARSMLYRWFTDATARQRYPRDDHDQESRVLVAHLRAALARRGNDAQVTAVVDALISDSEEFAGLWRQHEVAVRRSDHKRIVHPDVGLIELECQSLVAESQVQVLIVLTATPGTVSAERLQLLSVVEPQPRSAANQIPAELADGSPSGR